MSRGNRFSSRGGNSYNQQANSSFHRNSNSSYEGGRSHNRYDDKGSSRSSNVRNNESHEFRAFRDNPHRTRHRTPERHSPKRHRSNFYNAQGSRRDDYNGGTSGRYNARETSSRYNRPTAEVPSTRYVRPRENNMGPPASRRRPETSRDTLGIRGRGGILRRNDLRRQVIRKKLLNSIGPQRQPARSKNVQKSSKKPRRSRSRDKISVEKKSPSEKKPADTVSTNNKEPTEDNWDLDIENEIDFDEIEADETVESKQSAESKSDCGSTATGRYAATGEIKVALPAKETASAENNHDESVKESNKTLETGRKRTAKRSIEEKTGKSFIKLTCQHCDAKCVTFREYASHLLGRNHRFAMRKIAMKIRTKIQQMRVMQRQMQKTFELESKNTEALKPLYCLLCRLNYRQLKADHQTSDGHNQMKLLLTPYCKPCRNTFKSPMAFEAHRCSLEHIRKKARLEQHDRDDVRLEDLDLENFTTVDEVWTGDVDDDDDMNLAENESPGLIGRDQIKLVEVNYCGICRVYLSRRDEQESAIKRHCMGRAHLKEFIRFKKDAKHLQKDIPDKSIVMKTEPLAEEKSGKTEELCNTKEHEEVAKSNGTHPETNSSLMTELNDEIDEEEMVGDVASDKFERYFEKQNDSIEKNGEINAETNDQDQ